LQHLASRFESFGVDSASAMQKAISSIGRTVSTQAAVLSYLDIFVVLMYGCLAALVLTIFLKKIDLGKASAH